MANRSKQQIPSIKTCLVMENVFLSLMIESHQLRRIIWFLQCWEFPAWWIVLYVLCVTLKSYNRYLEILAVRRQKRNKSAALTFLLSAVWPPLCLENSWYGMLLFSSPHSYFVIHTDNVLSGQTVRLRCRHAVLVRELDISAISCLSVGKEVY